MKDFERYVFKAIALNKYIYLFKSIVYFIPAFFLPFSFAYTKILNKGIKNSKNQIERNEFMCFRFVF